MEKISYLKLRGILLQTEEKLKLVEKDISAIKFIPTKKWFTEQVTEELVVLRRLIADLDSVRDSKDLETDDLQDACAYVGSDVFKNFGKFYFVEDYLDNGWTTEYIIKELVF